MTLPNKLTVARLVLAPIFFIAFNLRFWIGSQATVLSSVLCLILFACIESTDLLDGKIARKYHLVTDLGKLLDPFGDVLAHLTYFFCFVLAGIMQPWVFIIILYRELGQTFLRMMLATQGKVMPANMWGKSKTVSYAVGGVLGIFYLLFAAVIPEASWLRPYYAFMHYFVFILCAVASLGSWMVYLYRVHKEGSLKGMTR